MNKKSVPALSVDLLVSAIGQFHAEMTARVSRALAVVANFATTETRSNFPLEKIFFNHWQFYLSYPQIVESLSPLLRAEFSISAKENLSQLGDQP
ncbi:MAG: hypothetical protein Q7U78_04490 [Gallionella sp.]|nr:hypothetical protein [Gallionella sp.]